MGVNESYVPEAVGFGLWGEDMGALSSNTFEWDGGWNRVVSLLHFGGGLWFNLSSALPGDFTLTLDTQELVGSESRVSSVPVRGRYWWDAGSLGWQDGDTVDDQSDHASGLGQPLRAGARAAGGLHDGRA